MIYLVASCYVLLWLAAANADTSTTNWSNPGNGQDANNTSLVWNLGEQQVVAWNTDLSVFDVTLWQQDPGSVSTQDVTYNGANDTYSRGIVYSQTDPQSNVSNFTWVVQLYGNEIDNSSAFFFNIQSSESGSYPSAHFTINGDSPTAAVDADFLGLDLAGLRLLAIGFIASTSFLVLVALGLVLGLCANARRLKQKCKAAERAEESAKRAKEVAEKILAGYQGLETVVTSTTRPAGRR